MPAPMLLCQNSGDGDGDGDGDGSDGRGVVDW